MNRPHRPDRNPLNRLLPLMVLVATGLAGCDDSTGVGDPEVVHLSFAVTTPASAPLTGPSRVPSSSPARVAGGPLVIEGTNGTLTIDEVRLIVAEVELDGDDDGCQDSDSDDSGPDSSGLDDDCAEFEAPPRFLDLPLDGQPVEAFVGLVPPGVYDELEFEIEDLEDDADDEWASEIGALEDAIRDEFPDWPSEATALVVGSFAAPGEDAVDFRVYLEAEIEIERNLSPPLVIGDGGSTTPDLTVDVRPDVWFSRPDGSVMDLSAYDYDQTGAIVEFELEMEDGFAEIEIDDD